MTTSFVAIALVLAFSAPVAPAQQKATDWGYIKQIRTGWVEDSMAVFTDAPVLNTGCKATDAGYATNPSDPGHKLFHAALLGAYFNNKRVQIILQDCAFDKPRIIGVYVKD